MVESIGRIAAEVKDLFVPYVTDALKILLPYIAEANLDLGPDVVNTLAMILSGIKAVRLCFCL